MSEGASETRTNKEEQRVLAVLHKHDGLSAMDIHKRTKFAHADILRHLEVLTRAGAVRQADTGRTMKYHLVSTGAATDEP